MLIPLCQCRDEKPPPPIEKRIIAQFKVIHNPCFDKWAIMTSIMESGSRTDTLFFGLKPGGGSIFIGRPSQTFASSCDFADTNAQAPKGLEFQFSTKDSAIIAYAKWQQNPDSVARRKQIADSIFKCQHTYR